MSEVQTALSFLERLSERGRQLRASLASDPANGAALDDFRRWQADVAVAVNELSGGSKAHWLSKAFSAAFLIAAPERGDRALVVEAPPADIVARLLDVLGQAHLSLTQVATGMATFMPGEPPPPRRFEFVHDATIRPVLEQAYIDAERGLQEGDAAHAFLTFCSVLEAIITDALNRTDVAQWPFADRIAAAESAGLIHAGCARLPAAARRYRERTETDEPVTIRDANVVRQVLHVVMRDLDPGR